MSDYKETQVSGKQWRRCNVITINNPVAPASPNVIFSEQDVISVDEKTIQLGQSNVSISFDPSNLISLLDPQTLEPTGETISEGVMYLALFSRYIAAAQARDVRDEQNRIAMETMVAVMATQPPAIPTPTPI